MSDESYSFSTARTRLDEIVSQVRKKDTSLEKSLDLLEEGVRLANACTEMIDHADWSVGGVGDDAAGESVGDGEVSEGAVASTDPVAEGISGDTVADDASVQVETDDAEPSDSDASDEAGESVDE
ncbi:MAG: exodeoxyribonuclease VII small subunit [Coriobacteriia bacterium]|nr:exodeoxyribonuclease VII small subunit [Coriobacteriia bacterium]